DALLAVRDLHAWYGESHILHGINFEVRKGELVTLIGRNGAGKTTTLKSIMGMVGRRKGSIRYAGQELLEGAPSALSRFVDAVSDLTIRRLAGAIGLPGSM